MAEIRERRGNKARNGRGLLTAMRAASINEIKVEIEAKPVAVNCNQACCVKMSRNAHQLIKARVKMPGYVSRNVKIRAKKIIM
jgi:hypothetical protein